MRWQIESLLSSILLLFEQLSWVYADASLAILHASICIAISLPYLLVANSAIIRHVVISRVQIQSSLI